MPASIRPALIATISSVGVLAVAVTVAQQAPEPLGRWLSDYPLPAIDRGLRDQDPPRPPRTDRADLSARQHRREVPRRHLGDGAAASMAALVDGDMTPAAVERELRRDAARGRRRRRAGGGAAERPARRGLRAGAVPGPARSTSRTTRSTRGSGTSPPSTWSGPGTSTPAARRPSPWRCWIRASPIAAACCARRRSPGRERTACGSRRSGTLDIPFAAAPDLAGPDRFVAPRDFIWGDVLPLRHGRPRHARRGHDRTADQQQRGRGRHGLQRPDHAGEGHRRRVGPGVQQPVCRHRRHGGAGRALRRGQRRQGAST